MILYSRDLIHQSIQYAIHDIQDTINNTQNIQMKKSLIAAKDAKNHYKNVVEKYTLQISRYQSKINSSIAQQKELRKQLEDNRNILNNRPVLYLKSHMFFRSPI